jgi:HSP20 family protein
MIITSYFIGDIMSNISLWNKNFNDLGLRDLEKMANRMFSNFFKEFDPLDKRNTLLPVCNFYETDNNYHLSMELPGVSKGDIDLSISGDTLQIKGDKKYEK